MELNTDNIIKGCEHDGSFIPVSEVKRLMIKFAKLHVQAALETACIEGCLTYDSAYNQMIDKNSIINSYPIENIK